MNSLNRLKSSPYLRREFALLKFTTDLRLWVVESDAAAAEETSSRAFLNLAQANAVAILQPLLGDPACSTEGDAGDWLDETVLHSRGIRLARKRYKSAAEFLEVVQDQMPEVPSLPRLPGVARGDYSLLSAEEEQAYRDHVAAVMDAAIGDYITFQRKPESLPIARFLDSLCYLQTTYRHSNGDAGALNVAWGYLVREVRSLENHANAIGDHSLIPSSLPRHVTLYHVRNDERHAVGPMFAYAQDNAILAAIHRMTRSHLRKADAQASSILAVELFARMSNVLSQCAWLLANEVAQTTNPEQQEALAMTASRWLTAIEARINVAGVSAESGKAIAQWIPALFDEPTRKLPSFAEALRITTSTN
ncbi:hypothetical protein [Nibricoccus sp. IMCC34717]|uniref:hypothetical protein n=1 Tax=Nibricoccus sp. IMCC34717 TaxID=3034021 RepID=UPI00384AED71